MQHLPSLIAFVALSGACGTSVGTEPSLFIPFSSDGGFSQDTTELVDTNVAIDAGGMRDRDDVQPSAPDVAGRDVVAPPNYGTCGRTVRAAICACDQSNVRCVDDAYGATSACDECIADAQDACCPSQSAAYLRCADAAGCRDVNCAERNCPTQLNAFLSCITTQWDRAAMSMSGSCHSAMVGCLGSYPVRCND